MPTPTDYRKKFRIDAGRKAKLADIDPGYKSHHGSEEGAQQELQEHTRRIDKFQYRLYAEHRQSLLIVLQGLDASGKDGTVRHVFSGVNPQSCKVTSFKRPSSVELDHDFLWRIHPHVPAKGELAIFNRSHYESVLIERVHDLAPKNVWSKRYEHINAFEKLLADEGTTIVKFFLNISKGEQKKRLEEILLGK